MLVLLHSVRNTAIKLTNIAITKHISINRQGQDYFVGDIHGHHHLLMAQLAAREFDFDNDRLFCVGDIIDRGAESEKCLELLIEPWFFSVIGNHEYLFLQGFDNRSSWQLLIESGGQWIKKWLENPSQLLAWAHLIRIMMPLSITVTTKYGTIGITHANSPQHWLELQNSKINHLSTLLWQRQNFKVQGKAAISGIDAVFHGHNSVSQITTINNQLWADTLQMSGRLTILSAYEIMNTINKTNDERS